MYNFDILDINAILAPMLMNSLNICLAKISQISSKLSVCFI